MDAYSHQNEMHTAFMENRSASLIGRTDILDMVDTFVNGESLYDVTVLYYHFMQEMISKL